MPFAICQICVPKKASHSACTKKSGENVDEIDPRSVTSFFRPFGLYVDIPKRKRRKKLKDAIYSRVRHFDNSANRHFDNSTFRQIDKKSQNRNIFRPADPRLRNRKNKSISYFYQTKKPTCHIRLHMHLPRFQRDYLASEKQGNFFKNASQCR